VTQDLLLVRCIGGDPGSAFESLVTRVSQVAQALPGGAGSNSISVEPRNCLAYRSLTASFRFALQLSTNESLRKPSARAECAARLLELHERDAALLARVSKGLKDGRRRAYMRPHANKCCDATR
jgi:hypothetical protein